MRLRLLGVFLISFGALDAQHVVPLVELQREAQDNARQRKENLAKLDRFLAGNSASTAMKAVNVNREQVQHAVALLSDSEIAALSRHAPQPTAQQDEPKRSGIDRRTLYLAATGAAALTVTLIMILK